MEDNKCGCVSMRDKVVCNWECKTKNVMVTPDKEENKENNTLLRCIIHKNDTITSLQKRIEELEKENMVFAEWCNEVKHHGKYQYKYILLNNGKWGIDRNGYVDASVMFNTSELLAIFRSGKENK